MTNALTLNLGMRWAYTQPLTEKNNLQSNFSLVDGSQTLAQDGSIESRALYNPYYKGFEPRLGLAFRPSDRWVLRGGYGISQYMEGTGANLRLPLNPPFFFESNVSYDQTTGAGTITTGFEGLVPQNQIAGQPRAWDPNLRPQFTQQWNAFVEYLVRPSVTANVGYVGNHATHLVTPETDDTCHYHFGFARNFQLDDAAMSKLLYEGTVNTFLEDKVMLEAQQKNLSGGSIDGLIHITADAAQIQARRMLDELVRAEARQ